MVNPYTKRVVTDRDIILPSDHNNQENQIEALTDHVIQRHEYMAFDTQRTLSVAGPTSPIKVRGLGRGFKIDELIAAGSDVQMCLLVNMGNTVGPGEGGETVTAELWGEVNDAITFAGPIPGLTLSTTAARVDLLTPWVSVNSFWTGTLVPAGGVFFSFDLYLGRTGSLSSVIVWGATAMVRCVMPE